MVFKWTHVSSKCWLGPKNKSSMTEVSSISITYQWKYYSEAGPMHLWTHDGWRLHDTFPLYAAEDVYCSSQGSASHVVIQLHKRWGLCSSVAGWDAVKCYWFIILFANSNSSNYSSSSVSQRHFVTYDIYGWENGWIFS